MKLHDMKPAPGSRKPRKRVGRGDSSGLGKTAGRGDKGQKSRTGAVIRPFFEGGQIPLFRRLPKRGFKNADRIVYQLVNLSVIDANFAAAHFFEHIRNRFYAEFFCTHNAKSFILYISAIGVHSLDKDHGGSFFTS